jgi:hypothetical protein
MKLFLDHFGVPRPFIGMVHLLPTVGHEGHPGLNTYLEHAVREAKTLAAGGAHAALVENDHDQPHLITVAPEHADCIQKAAQAVRDAVTIPVGVNVLLNDWKAALDIAKACNLEFIRIDVFVDEVDCVQGRIKPQAAEIIAYRKQIGAENVLLFTDIQVKHKSMVDPNKDLLTSAKEAIDAGSDALVVTGDFTGDETPVDDLRRVKQAFPAMPLLAGAGVTAENIAEQIAVADGVIVGTSLKNELEQVDIDKVRAIVSQIPKE